MRLHRSIFTALVLVLVAATPASAAKLGFAAPRFIDDEWAGGEPVLISDPIHKTLLYSSHAGTTHLYRPGVANAGTLDFFSTYRNQTFMWVSEDNGKTWKRVEFGGGFSTNPSQNSGFSDPDFTIDEGGRVYNTGINLANDALFSSPDGGKTWDRGTPECTPGDRPWLAGGHKDEVFLATNLLATSPSHQVVVSTDGGNTCSATGIPAGGELPDGTSWTGNGKLYYDRASDQLIEPMNFGSTSSGTGGVGIDVWKRDSPAFVPFPAAKSTMYAHWPAIALDDAGTVYLVWDDNPTAEGSSGGCDGTETPLPNHISMAYTKDFGKTWSKPLRIAAPANRRVLWPWVAAGEAGRVSIVWYETDKVVDLACENAELRIMAAHVMNATDDATRTIDVADAAGRPISVGNICQSGTTCVATGEDRRLGDFFTNWVDLNGCVFIGSGDTTRTDPATGQPLITSRPLLLNQVSGPRLRGAGDCSGKEDPGADLGLPPSSGCQPRTKLTITLRAPRGSRLRSARVTVNGKRAKVRRKGKRLITTLNLRGKAPKPVKIRVVAVTTNGKRVRYTRTYRTCKKA